VRLTGGEPTVRRDIERLVGLLAAIPGIRDLSMTTNGHRFADKAESLAKAGLKRVNISLDSLDPEGFRRITRGGDLSRVLSAISAARECGMTPIKVNAVVVGGDNDDQVLPLIEYFSAHSADTVVRFIEYMPFRALDGSGTRHVPVRVLRERIGERYTLVPDDTLDGAGPATRFRVAETGLRIGFISPITEHFCQACNRLRVQADGHLRTCLSREPQRSLRELLRDGVDDAALEVEIRARVWGKVAGHEAHLEEARPFEGVMTAIGG
jgi:cyclic pyranopterin phosphate synthase